MSPFFSWGGSPGGKGPPGRWRGIGYPSRFRVPLSAKGPRSCSVVKTSSSDMKRLRHPRRPHQRACPLIRVPSKSPGLTSKTRMSLQPRPLAHVRRRKLSLVRGNSSRTSVVPAQIPGGPHRRTSSSMRAAADLPGQVSDLRELRSEPRAPSVKRSRTPNGVDRPKAPPDAAGVTRYFFRMWTPPPEVRR
jgi:hypothetical protein